ncbi:unannotated protein [freshwater metagenome]|uniref:Unannotated protein n=1 Tax=freshwater metagenome TaxID=449393 RepID=A0A6J6UXL9_9ZZZZ
MTVEAAARIATQGGVEAAEPKPTKCQDSLYFAIRSIAPLGGIGSAPPVILPNLFREAISEIMKVESSPTNSGRFLSDCQLDLRGAITRS